jgi:hypothetical protein
METMEQLMKTMVTSITTMEETVQPLRNRWQPSKTLWKSWKQRRAASKQKKTPKALYVKHRFNVRATASHRSKTWNLATSRQTVLVDLCTHILCGPQQGCFTWGAKQKTS